MLKPPCSYQGGKQRVAKQIVDYIIQHETITNQTKIYDLCCGSGAITLEWINRGINPSNIIMLDISSWGKFWYQIGNKTFSLSKWEYYCNLVPKDKNKIQGFLLNLSKENAEIDEAYKYLLLQAGSFGAKQIWREGNQWKNISFRNYWQPTKNSNRRSPVNPMQPNIEEIKKRVINIAENCKGVTCFNKDISAIYSILSQDTNDDSIIYIDPPYSSTTKYGFSLSLEEVLTNIFDNTLRPIYVSEKDSIAEESILLKFNGNKGGISGNKKTNNKEWLNVFR